MTTNAITQATPTKSTRRTRRLIVAAVMLVVAIAYVIAVLISGIFTSTAQTHRGGSGADTSYCRPTTVVHLC
jgi:hypothetical protein